jgi:hypothetical protein
VDAADEADIMDGAKTNARVRNGQDRTGDAARPGPVFILRFALHVLRFALHVLRFAFAASSYSPFIILGFSFYIQPFAMAYMPFNSGEISF